jgi:hypothetical protein
MFGIIKSIIWIAGILVVGYVVLDYFGYEVNKNYFDSSRTKCQKRLEECTDNLLHQGIDNVRCDINCADTDAGVIIKKKKQ